MSPTVTLALAITAPLESLTLPTMLPVSFCAQRVWLSAQHKATITNNPWILKSQSTDLTFISPPPELWAAIIRNNAGLQTLRRVYCRQIEFMGHSDKLIWLSLFISFLKESQSFLGSEPAARPSEWHDVANSRGAESTIGWAGSRFVGSDAKSKLP